jgi:D-amino-acid oxidase
MKLNIAVIGAGVIGLSSGIRLLENGFDVTLFAREIPHKMTSAPVSSMAAPAILAPKNLDKPYPMASHAAPAFWLPLPYSAYPEDSVLRWAKTSLEIYRQFTPEMGVSSVLIEEFYHEDLGLPLWTKILDDYIDVPKNELPPGYARALFGNTLLIDTSIYLEYLLKHFQELGGVIHQQEFFHLHEVDEKFKIIINCSGVSSNQLVPDEKTFPIRGQYLVTEKIPALKKIVFSTVDEDNYILIVPRTNDCYIGGTTRRNDWNTEVDEELSKEILRRAKEFEPLIKDAVVKYAGVGLRPGRESVRLEAEQMPDQRTVIHNYGHGGSGYTCSWGCADDVVELVKNK